MAVDYYSYHHNEHKVEEQRESEEDEEDDDDDDDYIDMEVSSLAQVFPLSNNSISQQPLKPREFEFQMSSSINVERHTTTSPADELFYMGKLLPLHLPPRLQMVEKILKDSTLNKFNAEFYSTTLGTDVAVIPTTSTSTSTPFESCYVSPVESCRVSRELDPKEYLRVLANGDDNAQGKKSWTKKLKTKIKSLFGKSDDIYFCAVKKTDGGSNVKAKEVHLGRKINGSKENPSTRIPQVIHGAIFEKQNDSNESKIFHRRSFSGAFKRRYSTTNTKVSSSFSLISCPSSSSSSSSSSMSSNSNGLNDNPLLKRSSSANSEIEASLIQGAIAHCKQSSQQAFQARKTFSEVIGSHSFPTSKFESLDDQISLCRG